MKDIGLDLLTVGHHPPQTLVELARTAHAEGFDRLWYADERFFRDCWSTLGYLAGRIAGMGLGVCVTDPFVRHPAVTATAAATVDELCESRFTLGLGAGVSGFEAMGIERVKPLTAMRETIELIRSLLAGDRVDVSGEVVTFGGSSLDLPPRPGIPIMIATNGPRMLELAGELADEVMVQGMASETMAESVRRHIAVGAARAGRDPSTIRLTARLDLCISDRDPMAARAAMRPGLVRHMATHHPRYASFKLAGVDVPNDMRAEVSAMGYDHHRSASLEQQIPETWIDRFCLAGDSEAVSQKIGRLVEAGVDAITVMPVPVGTIDASELVRTVAGVTRSAGFRPTLSTRLLPIGDD